MNLTLRKQKSKELEERYLTLQVQTQGLTIGHPPEEVAPPHTPIFHMDLDSGQIEEETKENTPSATNPKTPGLKEFSFYASKRQNIAPVIVVRSNNERSIFSPGFIH